MASAHLTGGRSRLRRLSSIAIAAAALCLASAFASSAIAATFNPALVISDDNMRAYDSMSQSDVQAFLGAQPGPLKSMSFPRHDKTATATASTIIWEASQAWHINPRVMLTMLQKEQSLLTRKTLVTGDHGTLDWAVGMGCPDSAPRVEKYRGFGNQLWYAAQRLDGYGEGKNGSTVKLWKAPSTAPDGMTLKTLNLATYKLYVYNPSIGAKSPYGDLSGQDCSGNANFWKIYRKYFGDTFANPAIRPIYRLRNVKNGNFLYTKSQTERYNLVKSGTWRYEKVAFSWDTSVTANNQPVMRFFNRKTKQYLFTASGKTTRWLRSSAKKATWRFDGGAFNSSSSATSATPVYQFTNKKTGMYFLTTSNGEKNSMRSASNRKKWAFKGIAFYMAHK